MSEIITILNQKGGCGKTTTAVNLGAALAQLGRKVLVIDIDPQGNATTSLGINKSEIETSTYALLLGKCSFDEAIMETSTPNLYVIPSNISLSGAEMELTKEIGYHYILNEKIEDKCNMFD